ncbi:unnamed protein product [Commensalibacter communis]|uniref:Helix-turn-helix domain-containing protein n=1 Tax=Commensalibacter communis TaxID=2972786 RepID=A0A9W4XI69_9PROT|nr:helix-turn-helix domain-containing protein [Commensalibacter communis]CAI3947167.1 unnamed protein product [Commensalibacter communis]CAI3947627.1 unnamed protein product [Commensalibacter communis]
MMETIEQKKVTKDIQSSVDFTNLLQIKDENISIHKNDFNTLLEILIKSLNHSENYIPITKLCEKFGVSEPTIYEWINTKNFPPGITFSARCVRYPESQINQWILNQTMVQRLVKGSKASGATKSLKSKSAQN